MAAEPVPFLHTAPFVVDGWRIRPSLLEAERDGERHVLEPKVMGVLCVLAARADEAVPRGDLFEAVWPDVVVGDDVLTRCVSELRKLFGDRATAPRVIATVPRVGYRLVASVTPDGTLADEAPPPDGPEVARLAPAPAGRRPWLVAALMVASGVGALALASWLRPEAPSVALASQPLTSAPGYEIEPALAPDGTQVAYMAGEGLPGDLLVIPAAGGEPLRVASGSGYGVSPRWSPDGAQIAYVRVDAGRCEVRLVAAVGGPERTVAPCPGGFTVTLDWLPDGRTLLTGGHADGHPTLSRLDVESGRAERLAYGAPAGVLDTYPRVASDGRRVLFNRRVGGAVEHVARLDLDTGRVTLLTEGLPAVVGLTWLGDGVLYSVARGTSPQMLQLASADGAAAAAPFGLDTPGYRPDVAGGRLVVERWRIDAGLYDVALPEAPGDSVATLVPFAPSTAYDGAPQISPDGTQVAFLSERSGTPQVWVAARDGTDARAVTDQEGVMLIAARWSPDSARLAFVALVDGDADAFVIDRLGAPPRRLPAPGSSETSVAWASDGQWLLVGSDRSGETDLWRVPVGGGSAVRLTRDGSAGAVPAPGDDAFYTVRTGEPGVWRYAGEGPPTLVLPDLPPRSHQSWAATSDGFLFLDHRVALPEALRWTDGRPLVVLPRGGVVSSLSRGPDGRLLVARVGGREVDLALAHLGSGQE